MFEAAEQTRLQNRHPNRICKVKNYVLRGEPLWISNHALSWHRPQDPLRLCHNGGKEARTLDFILHDKTYAQEMDEVVLPYLEERRET